MFKPMLEKPVNNPYYITKDSGGYNTCGKGKPSDPECNALANCISFAVGRFNEIAEAGWCHWFGSMNASSFYTVAVRDYKFPVSKTAVIGAIACWSGGKDGKGHVASVEVDKGNHEWIFAESGYNNYVFRTRIVSDTDKNFGMPSSYKFQGFVVNPYIKLEDPKIKINDIIDNINNELDEIKELVGEL